MLATPCCCQVSAGKFLLLGKLHHNLGLVEPWPLMGCSSIIAAGVAHLVAPVCSAEGTGVRGCEPRGIQAPGGDHAALAHPRKSLPTLAEAHLHMFASADILQAMQTHGNESCACMPSVSG